MISPELNEAIDAAVPAGVTHIGFVATNIAGDFLITEPKGHPYGVSATFSKVKIQAGEQPHQTLQRCINEQVGQEPMSVYPIPVVWATANSRGLYFVGLLQNEGQLPSQTIPGLRWCSPGSAKQNIGTSQNRESRQRDLGILAAAAAVCVSPYRRILLMVRELHQMGFERLRAPAYMYPIAWRCPIVPAYWTSSEHGGLLQDQIAHLGGPLNVRLGDFTYSSASGQLPFDWKEVVFASPRELAVRFVQERREIAFAGWGPDPEYVQWFKRVLEMTAPNGLYYAMGEYEMPTDSLYTYMTSSATVPLPPPGLARGDEWAHFAARQRTAE
jgi:hypothetical protein